MSLEARIKAMLDILGPDIKALQTPLSSRLGPYGQQVTDWDAALSAGFYWGSNTAINGPVASTWFMGRAEAAFNSNNIVLTVWDYATGSGTDTKAYRRHRLSGVWGSWERIRITQAELDLRYAQLAHVHAAADISSGVLATARLGSGTPGAGKYVDGGSGAWTTLPGGSDPYSWEILASQVNNSSNVTDVNIFTGFQPAASTRYHVEIMLSVLSAAAATAVRTTLSGPTTGVTMAAVKTVSAASGSADHIQHVSALNQLNSNTAGLTTATLIRIEALLDFGAGVNAVNLRPQLRSEVLASQVSVLAGSYMKWRILP